MYAVTNDIIQKNKPLNQLQNCLVNRVSESCGNNPGSPPEGARYHECDNETMSKHKMILLLKFACNTDLGLKNWLHDKKNKISAAKQAKSANYASSAFFRLNR